MHAYVCMYVCLCFYNNQHWVIANKEEKTFFRRREKAFLVRTCRIHSEAKPARFILSVFHFILYQGKIPPFLVCNSLPKERKEERFEKTYLSHDCLFRTFLMKFLINHFAISIILNLCFDWFPNLHVKFYYILMFWLDYVVSTRERHTGRNRSFQGLPRTPKFLRFFATLFLGRPLLRRFFWGDMGRGPSTVSPTNLKQSNKTKF